VDIACLAVAEDVATEVAVVVAGTSVAAFSSLCYTRSLLLQGKYLWHVIQHDDADRDADDRHQQAQRNAYPEEAKPPADEAEIQKANKKTQLLRSAIVISTIGIR